ncbi:hypothetical protein V8E36_008370 [Tilletia maclaganii]
MVLVGYARAVALVLGEVTGRPPSSQRSGVRRQARQGGSPAGGKYTGHVTRAVSDRILTPETSVSAEQPRLPFAARCLFTPCNE